MATLHNLGTSSISATMLGGGEQTDSISESVQDSPLTKQNMARTAQQLSSELMIDPEMETETPSEKLVRKSKQQPFVPIGEYTNVNKLKLFCSKGFWYIYFKNFFHHDFLDPRTADDHIYLQDIDLMLKFRRPARQRCQISV